LIKSLADSKPIVSDKPSLKLARPGYNGKVSLSILLKCVEISAECPDFFLNITD
jgi:hypothetical protein